MALDHHLVAVDPSDCGGSVVDGLWERRSLDPTSLQVSPSRTHLSTLPRFFTQHTPPAERPDFDVELLVCNSGCLRTLEPAIGGIMPPLK